jgi:hypothetical protein
MRNLRNLLIGTNNATIGFRSGRAFVAGLLTHGQSLYASLRSLVSRAVGVTAPAFALANMCGATAQLRHDAHIKQALGLAGAKRSWRPMAGSARSVDES